jgi:hypothetical protein
VHELPCAARLSFRECARPPAGHPGHRHSIAARMVRTDTDVVEEFGELHQMHARLSCARQASTCRQRGPSVAVRGKPTVTPTTRRAPTPSAIRPWTPRHGGPQRYKVTHDGTQQNGPPAREFAAEGPFTQVVAGNGFEVHTTTGVGQGVETQMSSGLTHLPLARSQALALGRAGIAVTVVWAARAWEAKAG